ncbi:MAG: phosphotransferase family protein [Dehalococcoidia bacterium]|nr:phosphotransferase family protein [Dehalococcoidia bacterium]
MESVQAPSPAGMTAWLRRLPGFERADVTAIAPLDGGASNLTCRVDIAAGPATRLALRMQRERGIFEPYDVLREGEVLRRLAASTVPVPAVVAAEPDPAALGAPFLLLEWIDAPHMGVAGPEADFGAFTEMVSRIHGLDWRALGLDFLGVPADAAAALRGEIALVAARMERFAPAEPLLTRARDILLAKVPTGGRLALCQGDINVFNYLFRARAVAAVVDWEQARISDPRSDVGQLLALSALKGAPWGAADAAPFAAGYGIVSGEPLTGMAYFRAFWLWQLGVIYHGWRAFNGNDPWYSWGDIDSLLSRALAELD